MTSYFQSLRVYGRKLAPQKSPKNSKNTKKYIEIPHKKTNKRLHKIYTNFKNCDIVQEDFVPYHSFYVMAMRKMHAFMRCI